MVNDTVSRIARVLLRTPTYNSKLRLRRERQGALGTVGRRLAKPSQPIAFVCIVLYRLRCLRMLFDVSN